MEPNPHPIPIFHTHPLQRLMDKMTFIPNIETETLFPIAIGNKMHELITFLAFLYGVIYNTMYMYMYMYMFIVQISP